MAFLDKCATNCTIDTASTCPPVDVVDNSLGFYCSDPQQVPCLDQIQAAANGEVPQIVDPFVQIEACGMIPAFNFICNDNYSREVNRYLFNGALESQLQNNNKMDVFDQYQCYSGGLTAPMYASAFTAAENVTCINPDGAKGDVWAMAYKEINDVKSDRSLVEDAAAGATDIVLDTVEGIVAGGEITIIACSEDPCWNHPFTTEVVAVDEATGGVTLLDGLPGDAAAILASEDGCSTCETIVKYNHGAMACGCDLPEGGRLPHKDVEVKYTYFENFGEKIEFTGKDIQSCYKCAGMCDDATGNGYVDGLYAVKEKLGGFYKMLNEKMLQRYFFAKGPALTSQGAPLTGPGIITNMLRKDAEGCACIRHDFCSLNAAQKAAKIIDIMDEIDCCVMENNAPIRVVMNQIAYRKRQKLTREFNRLLGVPTCCEPQDGVKNFRRVARVTGYISDNVIDPELSYFLSAYYPNSGIVLFIPEGNTIMRTFDTTVENLNMDMSITRGTNVNFFQVNEIVRDYSKFQCEKSRGIQGSFLVSSIGCKRMAMIEGF